MANKTKNKNRKTDSVQSGPSANSSLQRQTPKWFEKHLSRRQVGKGLAWTAALGMAGLGLYKLSGSDEPEVAEDSLELQKKEGWNVGSTEKPLTFPATVLFTDSVSKTWGAFDPNYLISIYQPRDAKWQPFFTPTLLQSLSQVSLSKEMKLFRTGEMVEAYQ
ncbi:MAG: hypothetical protein ACRD82_04365, partial [Blastocatellia bacterium]